MNNYSVRRLLRPILIFAMKLFTLMGILAYSSLVFGHDKCSGMLDSKDWYRSLGPELIVLQQLLIDTKI